MPDASPTSEWRAGKWLGVAFDANKHKPCRWWNSTGGTITDKYRQRLLHTTNIAAQQKADTSDKEYRSPLCLRLCLSCFDGLVNDSVKLELNLMPERLFVPLEEWHCKQAMALRGLWMFVPWRGGWNPRSKSPRQGRGMYTGRAGLHLWKRLPRDVWFQRINDSFSLTLFLFLLPSFAEWYSLMIS